MRKLIPILLLMALPLWLEAQINLGNKIRNKVNQRVNQKVDKAVDDALDDVEGKAKKETTQTEGEPEAEANTETAENKADGTAKTGKTKLSSFTKFDFVPGETVIFYDDFAKSRIGEFPDYWLTNGMGQTVKVSGQQGQWLQLSQSSRYAPDKKFDFPADYTIEFDLIMLAPENHSLGDITIKLVDHQRPEDNLMAAWKFDDTDAKISLGFNSSSFHIHDNKTQISNTYRNNVLYDNRGEPVHVSIAVNGQRYRMWINEQKVFDVPQLLPKGNKRDHILIESNLNKEDPEYQAYISNFRVAKGKPDLRNALNSTGKFVTQGITFDSGSDQLKPESYGIIREIANVLEEDKAMRIRIVGHTDSDGNADGNLELSKKRAAAIKKALTDSYKIEASRLETDGKGAGSPIDKNTTAEGKANNRRAEFIKI